MPPSERHVDVAALLCHRLAIRVLCDVASNVLQGLPVDVTMGTVNAIWQGDANARAIQGLSHAATPPTVLNVTGIECLSIRSLAQQFGALLKREPIITGRESDTAWIWDASRSYELFGPPTVSLQEMIEATAHWQRQGGAMHGKPTHFEVRDGNY